jgi:hypothetical protein
MKRIRKSMAALLCAALFVGVVPMTALAAGIQANVPALTVNDTTTTIAFRACLYVIARTAVAWPQTAHLTLLRG